MNRPKNRRDNVFMLRRELREARQVAYMLKADLDQSRKVTLILGLIALGGWALAVLS